MRSKSEIDPVTGKTENQLEVEKILKEMREEYIKEHGRTPEEDGVKFGVLL